MIYLGIDPGGSGGIATVNAVGVPLAFKMPATEHDLVAMLWPMSPRHTAPPAAASFAVLERVWSAPGWGHVGAFSFGKNYGAIRAVLAAAQIPFDEVLPAAWQRAMGVSYPKGKPRDKNITKRRAQALFPGLTVTHALADALLLAEYCRRLHQGKLTTSVKGSQNDEKEGGIKTKLPAVKWRRLREGENPEEFPNPFVDEALASARPEAASARAAGYGAGPRRGARRDR